MLLLLLLVPLVDALLDARSTLDVLLDLTLFDPRADLEACRIPACRIKRSMLPVAGPLRNVASSMLMNYCRW